MGGTQNVAIVKVAAAKSPLTSLLQRTEHLSEFQSTTAFAEQVATAFLRDQNEFKNFKVWIEQVLAINYIQWTH